MPGPGRGEARIFTGKSKDPHRFEGQIGCDEGPVQIRNWTKATLPVRIIPGPEPIARFPRPPGWRMSGTNATPRKNDRGKPR